MRFTTTGRDAGDCLIGIAMAGTQATQALCSRYSSIAKALLAGESATVVPVVLDPWPFQDPETPLRRVFDADSEPGLFAAVAPEGAGDETLVSALPPDLTRARLSPEDVAMLVVMDMASWEADNTGPAEGLGWAQAEVKRAAIAARLLRSLAAAGLVGPERAERGYGEICACAMEGLAGHSAEDNAEALLAVEIPGLVAVLASAVRHARSAPPSPLPLVLEDEGDAALEAVARALAGTPPQGLRAA